MSIRLIASRCESKMTYPGRKVAAGIASRERARSGEPIGYYHCVRCHGFHLGHPPGWRAAQGYRAGVVS